MYSNHRKLVLSGWLKKNSECSYRSSVKLQKFLFLYESFAKVHNLENDFSYLKGYINGPVFSHVYGDYMHNREEFDLEIDNAYKQDFSLIDAKIVKKVDFIVKILTSTELSDLTHKMNIWKINEKRILNNERNIELKVTDFNDDDVNIIKSLDEAYDDKFIDNYFIYDVGKNHFLIDKKDIYRITPEHEDVLSLLSKKDDLKNPVYVEMDAEGRLLID